MKRIYLPLPLAPGITVSLPEDVQHRLFRVMRMGQGEVLHLFNGTGPTVSAEIADPKCRTATIIALLPERPALPHLSLALGLLKRDAWETALRQATEMGATSIIPLKTRFSQVAKINAERAHSIIVEAAEQSERDVLPNLLPVTSLEDFLSGLTAPCLWAYERLIMEPPAKPHPQPTTVLVGPEGGFAPEEVTLLQNNNLIRPFSLGPTILRADTAVVAALTHLSLAK